MTFGSVCSGIEAATVASAHLGWKPAFYSEIDPFCRSLLTEKYPDTPLYGDFSQLTAEQCGPVDLVCGGTPCQDFSVAGKRAGLDGARGNLTLEFVRLVERVSPRWVFWENVPGVLSIDGGRAFGAFLGALGQLGYGVAWRVLDAQYFGVPQRRKRVFVVGYFGDWRPAAAVLFESESVRGDSPPIDQAGQGIAPTITERLGDGGSGHEFDCGGGLAIAGTLRSNGAGTGKSLGKANEVDLVIPLAVGVRRLTPRECERLQGFPDDYTLIQHRDKPAADGPRYKALGNSWAVPCVRWIFERMEAVDAIMPTPR